MKIFTLKLVLIALISFTSISCSNESQEFADEQQESFVKQEMNSSNLTDGQIGTILKSADHFSAGSLFSFSNKAITFVNTSSFGYSFFGYFMPNRDMMLQDWRILKNPRSTTAEIEFTFYSGESKTMKIKNITERSFELQDPESNDWSKYNAR